MKKRIRLSETDLHRIINESVRRILKENEDFIPMGYKMVSNAFGYEIEIDSTGEAARLRFINTENPDNSEVTDWEEIQFDEDRDAYIESKAGRQFLSDFIRYGAF